MTRIAGGGGGNYRYLGDPERIVAALESEFRTASRTAASEVEIILRLRRECRFGSVLGRDWRRDGDSYVIRLGDLSAGERRTVFAKVNVAGDGIGLREVGDVALRYRDPATSKGTTTSSKAVSLELVRDEQAYREGFDRSVQEKRAVAEANVLMQEAARLADQGKKEEAKGMLGKAAAGLAAAPPSPGGPRGDGSCGTVQGQPRHDGRHELGVGQGGPEGDQVPGVRDAPATVEVGPARGGDAVPSPFPVRLGYGIS